MIFYIQDKTGQHKLRKVDEQEYNIFHLKAWIENADFQELVKVVADFESKSWRGSIEYENDEEVQCV